MQIAIFEAGNVARALGKVGHAQVMFL